MVLGIARYPQILQLYFAQVRLSEAAHAVGLKPAACRAKAAAAAWMSRRRPASQRVARGFSRRAGGRTPTGVQIGQMGRPHRPDFYEQISSAPPDRSYRRPGAAGILVSSLPHRPHSPHRSVVWGQDLQTPQPRFSGKARLGGPPLNPQRIQHAEPRSQKTASRSLIRMSAGTIQAEMTRSSGP
jgi:hypothetical protein